jgi:hypothetical protein
MKASFPVTDTTGKAVHQGHYQIVDENHTNILPQFWDKLVFPGSSIRMQIWQGPVHSKPLTPPPVRAVSPSPRHTSRRPVANESLKRQRTLKRRAGFVLPKNPLDNQQPPSPEDSSDEQFEFKRGKAMLLYDPTSHQTHSLDRNTYQIQSFTHSTLASVPDPYQIQSVQQLPLNIPTALVQSRHSYPRSENSRDTSRFATWSGFSKSSSQQMSEKARVKVQLKPSRARGLQEKVARDTPDQSAPRRSLSNASEKTIARTGVHMLRKEK